MSRVNGISQLVDRLKFFGSETDTFLKSEISAIGNQIAEDAKTNVSFVSSAPPEIKQKISNQITNDGYTTKITQNALPMGAYIEFGTGVYVTVAPEWKDMAWQFYVNGKGRLRAHPYLYPAFIKGSNDFMRTLTRKIEQLSNQFNRL